MPGRQESQKLKLQLKNDGKGEEHLNYLLPVRVSAFDAAGASLDGQIAANRLG